ncbi:hypothetical protein B0H14DRAFT_3888121 [Mycena olivaceomarginata]|nr:hypothetical protein B0H14DRAFT_3888121 [Mycena olivaceomarginata]
MSDCQLYSRLLLPKGHGYPLSHPQPFDDLPLDSPNRLIGIDIGDVGVVTSDGAFDVIFNICRSADDPVNRFGVPDGFEQVELEPARDIAFLAQYHPPGSDVSNTSISKRRVDVNAAMEDNVFLPLGAGAVVEISTSSKETAVLLLPDGASRKDLRPKVIFRDYALKHAQRWYAFVTGKLHRIVDNGDLYLVTGTDKASSWSVAAGQNHSEDRKISLKLKATQIGSAGISWVWEWQSGNYFADSGPRTASAEKTENQTVFLRGFKVTTRTSFLKKTSAKAISIVDSKPTDIFTKPGGFFSSQSRSTSTGSLFGSSGSSSSSGPSDDEESVDNSAEYFPGSLKVYHPASAINEYLLNSFPAVDVAVTHDDEWVSVLNKNDEALPDDFELLKRISGKYEIDTCSGGVWLRNSSQPTPHKCFTPSAMSRKAVPDTIVKKRLHSVAFSDDKNFEEELGVLSPMASEAEVIEYKRWQNTLAARKSRKRKLEHQQALEGEVQELTKLVTTWRERVTMAQELLRTFSPSTPALDSIEPASTVKGKSSAPVIPPAPTSTRRRSNVTGTWRSLTPAALIPLDAPTYVTPSVTSRKAVPDAIVKKRLHSVDDDDDEGLGELSPTASEAEIIEHKRRQNTLAARKSRKRKLEHQQALEGEVQDLNKLVTMWRERAMMAQELLRGSGVNLPFEDIES